MNTSVFSNGITLSDAMANYDILSPEDRAVVDKAKLKASSYSSLRSLVTA